MYLLIPCIKKTLNYFTEDQKTFLKRIFLLFNCLERVGRKQQFFQMKNTKKKEKRDEENFVKKSTVKNF